MNFFALYHYIQSPFKPETTGGTFLQKKIKGKAQMNGHEYKVPLFELKRN